MNLRIWATCIAAILLVATTASAHPQGECGMGVSVEKEGRVGLVLKLNDADVLDLLGRAEIDGGATLFEVGAVEKDLEAAVPTWLIVQGDGQPCPVRFESVEAMGLKGVEVRAEARCDGLPVELGLEWRAASLVENFTLAAIVAVSAPDAVAHTGLMDKGSPSLLLKVSEPDLVRSFLSFVALGAEHILIGWDHLAFLLALLLACRTWRRLVMIVTGFTLAHSVTLALGALGVVAISGNIVEPIIALSIAVAAAAALVRLKRGELSHPGSDIEEKAAWPEMTLCFAFGLIHGLGFASMLADALEGVDGIAVPLVGFNLGVELGQVAAVALAFPVLSSVGRQTYGKKVVAALLVGLAALGIAVFLARVSG